MDSKFRRELDPLDRAFLERAFESAWVAVNEDDRLDSELDSDEGLEATLRRELVEIALSNDIRDVETLRDILLDALSGE
jgi:hypothetical protein